MVMLRDVKMSGFGQGLYLSEIVGESTTLGPGKRAVLWVWGCSRGCPGCLASPFNGTPEAPPVAIEVVAEQLLVSANIEGVTFSGGEPFEQAEALTELVRALRRRRPELSFCSYSGFTLAELSCGSPHQHALLAELDLLIDGPFLRERAADLLWRGSSNQQIHFLTDRYHHWRAHVDGPGAGVELRFDDRERISWVGVPPPGFIQAIYSGLRRRGITLHPSQRGDHEPFTETQPLLPK
jgi:anaerobic ribonucleoside-triphosphate reductase activating protein